MTLLVPFGKRSFVKDSKSSRKFMRAARLNARVFQRAMSRAMPCKPRPSAPLAAAASSEGSRLRRALGPARAAIRMLDQLRPGDVVVIWKLDRLSRSLKDVLHIMEQLIGDAGAGFRSITEAIDT